MQTETEENKRLLAHHKQQPLCTSRLPYRQGRKLTAVKVYTIATESNHLLIFGVPALNLRQETKALFMKFGKLLQFNISPQHPSEIFAETYHAQYERIQSARIAKRMLDTKNFYGGSLHVCYAPEMETVEETRQKLLQRQKDVLYRLRNLQMAETKPKETIDIEVPKTKVSKLNMGEINTINLGEQIKVSRSKRKKNTVYSNKKFKPYLINDSYNVANRNNIDILCVSNEKDINNKLDNGVQDKNIIIEKGPVYNSEAKVKRKKIEETPVEVIDCTSIDKEVVTNINEYLNYDKFGNEDIRKVPEKPVNRIIFNVNKIS
ncbi:unnamed protein product [Parnassius apollo]|uniref:(apollo) hypothetical protein n=1 Tax=Parnassius apollo TaxID=110799 RepID=A0A8S3XC92_PARAO|nr:unnamed protein product [Parnassius apollo]